MSKESLILTGFMGMGKSTIGRILAEWLRIGYFDTDDSIENAGIDIPTLVMADMDLFRSLEVNVLRALLLTREGVVSTGGGVVSTSMGRAALLGSRVEVVWLKAPFEVAEARVGADTGRKRPLFKDNDKARKLFNDRQNWYEKTATFTVDASKDPEEVAGAILTILRP